VLPCYGGAHACHVSVRDLRKSYGRVLAVDGVSLTIATRDPADVLAGLAHHNALAGLRVPGATLKDVFLELTGREYRA
jgi:ABC-2 type transport system ATP-binding protein